MITRIDLRHFKCFQTLKLPLRPLTLLSGSNASGKTSVMQGLVLLHQTMRENEWSSRLMLNGSTIQLGTVADVIDQIYGRYGCGITLYDDDDTLFSWEFEGRRDEMSMWVKKSSGENGMGESWGGFNPHPLHYLLPEPLDRHSITCRLRDLTYLTAERLGPREQYPFDDDQVSRVVGPRGQYAVNVLHSTGGLLLSDGLVIENVLPTLFRQVEAWMAQFFPGCVLEIDQIRRTNALTLGIRVSNDTDFQRPVHTGFGLTQVLPIIVAALAATKNQILLIENPEVHLHPASQSTMGKFLARVASTGIQVVIETHSDHVLNGIRRAVKEKMLSCEDVALHYFRPRTMAADGDGPQVESLTIDASGNIDGWPEGFFDQLDRDLSYLAGWS